jgi:hypothetical protein
MLSQTISASVGIHAPCAIAPAYKRTYYGAGGTA